MNTEKYTEYQLNTDFCEPAQMADEKFTLACGHLWMQTKDLAWRTKTKAATNKQKIMHWLDWMIMLMMKKKYKSLFAVSHCIANCIGSFHYQIMYHGTPNCGISSQVPF